MDLFGIPYNPVAESQLVMKGFVIKKRDAGHDFDHVTVEDLPQSSACSRKIVNVEV